MANKLYEESSIQAIANAIRNKNGSSDTYTVSQMAQAIDNIPSGGGGTAEFNDVNFYDYDGTITNSYSAQEFLALSSLPANPDRTSEGLTAEGWNWSLSDAKSYVTSYGKLNVGQTYHTTDNKYHIWFNGAKCDLSNINSGTVINWGDGTTETTSGSSASHIYGESGEYEITVQTTSTSYIKINTGVVKIFAPSSVTSIGSDAISNCYSLQSINIPSSVTSIGSNAISNCFLLQSITIPSSVTSIGTSTFSNCYSLQSITIPSSVTSIGSNAISNCSSLQSITIPSSVTSIGTSTFSYCSSLQSINIPSSVTSIGSNAFFNCYSLQSITIPSSVTSIGTSTFSYCSSLQSITIPSSVTSISSNAFLRCSSLQSITIPSSVTSISSNAFLNCLFVYMTIKATTPPTLSTTITTNNLQAIYVPTESVETYQTDTSWSTYASYIQAEPAGE